ncbi:site-2 protease family protein [Sneathiella chinensis]|uniref:Peptidase M48 n=1 Tax=Sneathiella chinensis TaxID=349750 RepID=A0ABQ5U6F1_9PROT|nr:site-2 protease family protein [Sneathiella chinensis]GLQ07478.1 peptidase M48 [Sneathiella chinensis]
MDMGNVLYQVSIWLLPALLAITLHEAGHAFAAWRLGDDTAKRQGRVTLNPLKHVDPIGTVLIPGLLLMAKAPFLFGYAKPVPVNFMRLNHPRRDMVLVALAGPMMNFLLAFLCMLSFHALDYLPVDWREWVALNLRNGLVLNVVLGFFNLLPIPPLDGGRVAVGILPNFLAIPLARLERFGFLILIGVIILLPMLFRQFGSDMDPMRWLMSGPIATVISVIATLAGFD